jgi:hypothetical protein
MSTVKNYRDAPVTLSSLQQDLLDAAKEMRCAVRDMNEIIAKLERREELRTKRFEELMVVLSGDDNERLIAAE